MTHAKGRKDMRCPAIDSLPNASHSVQTSANLSSDSPLQREIYQVSDFHIKGFPYRVKKIYR